MTTKHLDSDVLLGMQQHIQPLNMNGLSGHMLHMPASKRRKKNRDILLVYGHHASLQRMYGIAEALNTYGAVTMPDLPGFGGMDSFYDIGMEPTVDNMADYLAAFVKLRFKKKKVTLVGMSLGFVYLTRMLQRYPELTRQVDLMLSIVGFSHHQDFLFSSSRQRYYRLGSSLFARKYPAKFFYHVALFPPLLRRVYTKSYNARSKFEHLSEDEKKAALDFEVGLWRGNDVRTHMHTARDMLTIDNCDRQIDLPVHHVSIDTDQYFDHDVVEQHMRIIYTDFIEHNAKLPAHAPSILATKKEAMPLFPASLKRVLRKK